MQEKKHSSRFLLHFRDMLRFLKNQPQHCSNPAGTAGRAKPSGEGFRLVHIPHCGLKNGGRGLVPPPPHFSGLPPAMLCRYLCLHGYFNLSRKKLQGCFREKSVKTDFPAFLVLYNSTQSAKHTVEYYLDFCCFGLSNNDNYSKCNRLCR